MHLILSVPEAFSFHCCVSLGFSSAPSGSETTQVPRKRESVLPASAGVGTKCEDLFLQQSSSASPICSLGYFCSQVVICTYSET